LAQCARVNRGQFSLGFGAAPPSLFFAMHTMTLRLTCLLSFLVSLVVAEPPAPRPVETKRHTVNAVARFEEEAASTNLVLSNGEQEFRINWAIKITGESKVNALAAGKKSILAKGIPRYPFKLTPEKTYAFTIDEVHRRSSRQHIPGLENEKGDDEFVAYHIVRVALGNEVIFDAEVCEVHHSKMVRKEVPVVYGLLTLDATPERQAFPHGADFVGGGCFEGPEKTASVYICPDCEKARAEWKQKAEPKAVPRNAAEVPLLFRQRSFDAAHLAEAVNYFVALGEQQAVRELSDLAPEFNSKREDVSLSERVGWVCRILFLPKGRKPLREPGYGGHQLPYLTMPLSRWPLYPVAASGDSFFVLSEGYSLMGIAENPKKYLEYCRANGVFRKQAVVVPTRAQAEKDVLALRQSPAWKAIQWKDGGRGTTYTISEPWIWSFIQAQADAIK
jgi:hypothetical protein